MDPYLTFPEPFYFPSIAFCRPALERKRSRLRPELSGQDFTLLPARIGFSVQFLSLGSRAPFAGQR